MSDEAILARESPHLLRIAVAATSSGIIFGLGLAAAQMTNPDKVLNFLDVTGVWDASLLFVLGAAVTVTVLTYHFVLRLKRPLFDSHFHLPVASLIDRSLIAGAALFGIGWGLAGYCPGPAIASLGFGNVEAFWFLPAMFAGSLLGRLQTNRMTDGK